MEAAIIQINWKLFFGDATAIATGDFKDHLAVIVFGAVALLYSVAETVVQAFGSIPVNLRRRDEVMSGDIGDLMRVLAAILSDLFNAPMPYA